MDRIYIDNDMARFVRKDLTVVDMELSDGRRFEKLEPRRLFPVSMQEQYITLLDEKGVEQAVIRDVNTLPKEQRQIIMDCLNEYYLIPKILKIRDVHERFDGLTLFTDTDKGPTEIEIRILRKGFVLDGTRVLIRDINDNRYEVPDINRVDSLSRQILGRYL